ncbi:MAG: hypothetical protein H7Y13_14620 [Sphingobacteriaceae bacterium]|nr:hypothetical protein [Sphingobacteriaceae bacterium]
MNQTFNLNRFSNLFIKHTADNYKTYLMAFSVLLGVLFLIMGFTAYVSGGQIGERAQIPVFLFVLLLSGTIFTSIVFADLGNKKKAISILTLPASHFEKYLIGWLYSFVIFQLLFIPAFYLMVMLLNHLGSLYSTADDAQLLNLFDEEHKVYYVFYLYAVLHAICLWGSVFFEKHHFIKTAFCFFIGMFLLMFLNTQLMSLLLDDKKILSAVPFTQVDLLDISGENYRVETPIEEYIYIGIIISVIVVILWACSFYRLKEKEV